ncbi:MAG: MATE family efflux transporter [Oscillospiraceae bacterium]
MGFNYGAKRYDRVLDAFWFCVKLASVGLVVIGVAGFIFAPQIVSLFRDDPAVISIGTTALRLQCVSFPFSSWVIMGNMLLQTIGRGAKASILALSRQGLFFLPAIFVLPQLWGLFGVQLSQPVADMFSFVLSLPLVLSVTRELKTMQDGMGRRPLV